MKHEYVVCRYVEAGNWVGEEKENVGDLKDGGNGEEPEDRGYVSHMKKRHHLHHRYHHGFHHKLINDRHLV